MINNITLSKTYFVKALYKKNDCKVNVVIHTEATRDNVMFAVVERFTLHHKIKGLLFILL